MTDQSLSFNTPAETPAPTPAAPAAPQLTIPESASPYVGEGKKYADVTTALAALPHQQTHIQNLEDENAELRKEIETRSTVQDTVTQLMETKTEVADTPTAGLDESTVSSLVDQRVKALNQEQTHEMNEAIVVKALADKFGEKAKEVYETRVQELNMQPGTLNTLSRTAPEAALQLLGLNSAVQSTTPMTLNGSVNSTALNDNTPTLDGRGYAYYKNLRKTSPRQYTKEYSQMQREAVAAERAGVDYFKT